MKHPLINLLLASLILLLFPSSTKQPNKAEELLKQSILYTMSLKDFEAKFSYDLSTPQSSQVNRTGKIRFKSGKYLIFTEDSHIYFNRKSHWVYLPKYNQFMEMDKDPYETNGVLHHMNSAFRNKEADRTYEGKETVEGIPCHKIIVTITDNSLTYRNAILWLNDKTLFPVKASFIDRRSTQTTYRFTGFRTNLGLHDEAFNFDPAQYPGVEKIDGQHHD